MTKIALVTGGTRGIGHLFLPTLKTLDTQLLQITLVMTSQQKTFPKKIVLRL